MPFDDLRAWHDLGAILDGATRRYCARRAASVLEIRLVHAEEQLSGAREELRGLGVLADREAASEPVRQLRDLIALGERDVDDARDRLERVRQLLQHGAIR